VELTVVIGTAGRDIPREQALSHVFGYTIVNDVTARDLQKLHGQWFKGKSLDTFCPMGPVLVTADEIPDPQTLAIAMRVNGETRQSSHTSKMIFPVDECIAVLSQGFTLLPGDVKPCKSTAMHSSTGKIILEVWLDWRVSPFTRIAMASVCGSGISSAVTSTGPMGQNVSSDLPL